MATIDQLTTQRDALMAQLSAPSTIRHSDGRQITNRSVDEIRKALAAINEQIDALSNSASRVSVAQHKRGDGPFGPSWPPPASDL